MRPALTVLACLLFSAVVHADTGPWDLAALGKPPKFTLEPGTGLVDLLHVLHELWTWNLWATGDEGLNHAAAQWARRQDPGRFPIDRRPLKRRSRGIPAALAPGGTPA